MRDENVLLAELGFPAWAEATGRRSVADLYRPGHRCGIYVLRFANGERYVGKAVDVIRRFTQHRVTHSDITGVSFQVVPEADLLRVERQFIHAFDAAGIPLRNLAHMSVVQGETDLDLVVTPAEQDAWFQVSGEVVDTDELVQDDDLRRRHRRKFEQFMTLPFAEDALQILGFYLQGTVPFPRRTELSFWMVSCLPYGVKSDGTVYLRVSLNMQETLSVYGTPEGLEVSVHLAKSPFEAELGSGWQDTLTEWGWGVEEHAYAPGGHDQFHLFGHGLEDARALMLQRTPNRAMALLNLRLMRKGPTYYGRSHCLELVDAAMASVEEELRAWNAGEDTRQA